MNEYTFTTLRQNPRLMNEAALWFHHQWGVPKEAYLACMEACLNNEAPFNWYFCLWQDQIVAGLGIIENDFHDRRDLSPNICAVYTLREHRGRGLAGGLLNMAVEDMAARGISPLYLATDHTGFYEKYGWEYICPVQCEGDDHPSRMYIHK